jgi:porin
MDIGFLGMALLLRTAAGMELEARDFRQVARRKRVLFRTLLLTAMHPLVLGFALALTVWPITAPAVEPAATNTPAAGLLLIDSLGRHVEVSTNEVPRQLHPPGPTGLVRQIPQLKKGAVVSEPVLDRTRKANASLDDLHFHPPVPPPLEPYLMGLDEFGNTAIQPGPLLSVSGFDILVQRAKYWLSDYGLRYSLQQTLTGASMTGVRQGDSNLGFYDLDFHGDWAVYNWSSAGMAGWLSAELEAKSGLSAAGATQSAQANLGMITEPTGIWSSVNGLQVPELAWQQSFRNGELVVVGGVVNQSNYLDANAYAGNGRGEFMNSALINSMVMPLVSDNFGANVQWQPRRDFYALCGLSVGSASPGHVPWTDFSRQQWSSVWEMGWLPSNVLGLGPGAYRIQPFLAQAGGPVQPGLCFNLRQQLGADSPFGWFGRFGFGGSAVSAGASAQVGTGLVIQGPLERATVVPRLKNDLFGIGFVWSQPSASTSMVYHPNEYGLESFYSLQLAPTVVLRPDMQVVWDPAFNPRPGPALVCQFQLAITW